MLNNVRRTRQNLQHARKVFLLKADMAKQNATEKLDKQDFALEPGTQNLNEDKALGKADAKLLQDSIKALQALDEDKVDPDLIDLGYSQWHHEAAEDADDEFDTEDDSDDDDDENDYEEVRPLLVKKAKTGVQVHLPTNHPEQKTQNTAHTHSFVKRENNLAQAETRPLEVGPTAHLASNQNLPRAPTPNPKPFLGNLGSGLLYPSPMLRRGKDSNASKDKTSDSPTDHSKMSNTRNDQDAPYGHSQDHAAETSATYLTPTQRSKMPEGYGSQNESSREKRANRAKISPISPSCTSSEEQALRPNEWGPTKASRVLGYVVEDETNPKKSMTDGISSPKASQEKMSFRKFFHRRASKEPTTPTSSGKTAGRMAISAPTLIDASPNAKALLNSASNLITESPGTKHVVNYSRPIVHSSSEVSSGSPVTRGGSDTALHGSNPFASPGAVHEGGAENSGNIIIGFNTSSIHDHSDSSIVYGHEAANEFHAVTGTLPTEKSADASNSDSFNPSDYSGDENSVQQGVAVPVVFAGRAKLIDIPSHRVGIAAPINQSSMGNPIASGTTQLTDHDAEILGAQDADRYYNNAMATRTRPTKVTTDDPFIDSPFRNLLARPANEIAAKEMERIRAGREEERQISAIIKGKLAAKDAANGGVRGAGFQRIDYGPPTARTALRGNPPSQGR